MRPKTFLRLVGVVGAVLLSGCQKESDPHNWSQNEVICQKIVKQHGVELLAYVTSVRFGALAREPGYVSYPPPGGIFMGRSFVCSTMDSSRTVYLRLDWSGVSKNVGVAHCLDRNIPTDDQSEPRITHLHYLGESWYFFVAE